MKLGICSSCYPNKNWNDVCDLVSSFQHITVLEVGAGGLNPKDHCNPEELLKDAGKLEEFKDIAQQHNLEIYSLGCFGNPIHPDRSVADRYHTDLVAAIDLASKLDVKVVNGMSGCPGAGEGAKYPNWIGLANPPEFEEYSKWQWEKKIIPYWKEIGKRLKDKGVVYGIEMHPGYSVYNPSTLLRLREEVGDGVIGCCFDPNHAFYQGADPIANVWKLGEAIVNVHAQDTALNQDVISVDGLFDTKNFDQFSTRAWRQVLPGCGHGDEFWRKLIYAIRIVGYNGAVNIEHHDALFSLDEGIRKTEEFLHPMLIYQDPTPEEIAFW